VKVLVTGASGFVGRHLLRELEQRGLTTVATGLPAEGGHAGGESASAEAVRPLDLRDAKQVERLVAEVEPDAVIHLAAQSSAGASFAASRETFEVNVLGTWHLVAALRDEAPGARFLAVTSGDLYGSSAPGAPHRETSPFAPVSPYGASKAAQDLLVQLAAAAYHLKAIRLRPFTHAGPGQRQRFALPAFAAQIAAIERGEYRPVLAVGNLDVVRDYTDVRDVVRAYADLLTRGTPGEAYNVCTGRGITLRDLVEKLTAASHVAIRVEVDPARLRPADLPHLVGDPAKLARATGWRPEIEIDRTLADLLLEARDRASGSLRTANGHRESI
jgi:GDP-4-dehydro-6-deoxy-D-mannose reductase